MRWRQFDTIVIEENIVPQADHWVRQRDLQRILRGQDTGHQIIEMLNADRTLRIEMVLDPFPQLIFNPPQQGRRWRRVAVAWWQVVSEQQGEGRERSKTSRNGTFWPVPGGIWSFRAGNRLGARHPWLTGPVGRLALLFRA